MMAAFGGDEVRCSDYATCGTPELSTAVLKAISGRQGCLMASHGMVVGGGNLTNALWLAHEMEALAHQHFHTLLVGGAHLLDDAQIDATAKGFAIYGAKAKGAAA